MSNLSQGCCSCGSSCCAPENEEKRLLIDFLYLDLSVCERCQGADNNLDEAIIEVGNVLKAAGYKIEINKVNITSKELAVKYEFLSSPTIRINGADIAMEVKESSCQECGDLCGDSVDCRVWLYEGVEYTEPPKALIVNAILKEVYGGQKTNVGNKDEYELPENLKLFFDGLQDRRERRL
jgi:hypothetical protein